LITPLLIDGLEWTAEGAISLMASMLGVCIGRCVCFFRLRKKFMSIESFQGWKVGPSYWASHWNSVEPSRTVLVKS
jgi:hypothetical protein